MKFLRASYLSGELHAKFMFSHTVEEFAATFSAPPKIYFP